MTKTSSNAGKAPPVRLKASQRKVRVGEVSRTPRVPIQERSRLRQKQIIEATERLLRSANIEDLSLYDVAKEASIAPASVHYLFSTLAAIHLELNRAYNIRLTEFALKRQRDEVLVSGSWQALTRIVLAAVVERLNEDRPMAEILLGPTLHRESAQANQAMNGAFGLATLGMLREVYVVPDIPNLEKYFTCATVIGDALWSAAYVTHGRIDDETFEESVRAIVSYLRCFLPETMALKDRRDAS